MVIFNELRITRDGKNIVIDARISKEPYYDNVYIKKIYIDTEDTYQEGGPSKNAFVVDDIEENCKEVRRIFNKQMMPVTLVSEGVDVEDDTSEEEVTPNRKRKLLFPINHPYNYKSDYLDDLRDLKHETEEDVILIKKHRHRRKKRIVDFGSFTKHLYFVYIETIGTPSSDVPCGMDEKITLGVTMHMGTFYDKFMNHIKEMNYTACCKIPSGLIDIILKFKAITVSIDARHYLQAIRYFKMWFTKTEKFKTQSNCSCHG